MTKYESTPEIPLKSCKKLNRKFLSSGIWRRAEWQGKWVPIEEKCCYLHLKMGEMRLSKSTYLSTKPHGINPDDSDFLSHCPEKYISHVQIEELIKKLSIR